MTVVRGLAVKKGGDFLQALSQFSPVKKYRHGDRLAEVIFFLQPGFASVHTDVNTVMYTLIEWDDAKNQRNLRKHGIAFSSAAELFNYPHLARLDVREDYGEERWIGIGWIGPMIGVVVFTLSESEDHSTSVLRILSARKASKREVTLFDQEIKN